MGYTPLVFTFVFLALGLVFLAQGKKESDAGKARNSRFAGTMMLIAAAGFLAAFLISFLARGS